MAALNCDAEATLQRESATPAFGVRVKGDASSFFDTGYIYSIDNLQ